LSTIEQNVDICRHDLDFVDQQQSELELIIAEMESSLGVDDWLNGTAMASMPATRNDMQRESM
jgi:hypothetical protein